MDGLTKIENDWTAKLTGAGFVLYKGWSDDLADKLVTASREPLMQVSVPRDIGERFVDRASANAWYAKTRRGIYTLFRGDQLAGIVWYSLSPRPDLEADYTFAIRMYEISRGQGLAHDFARAAATDFAVSAGYHGSVWLETNADNVPAKKVYEKFGFRVVDENAGRLTLVNKP